MTAMEWRIRVKALMENGAEKEYYINTLSDETVGDIRNRLATTSQVEPQKQRLIFRGRLLVDNTQKLMDAGVGDGSALHMIAKPSAMAAASTERSNSQTQNTAVSPHTAQQQQQQHSQAPPSGLAPLAAQVMDQTMHRLRTLGPGMVDMPLGPGNGVQRSRFHFASRGVDGMPQLPPNVVEHIRRSIDGVFRDFGARNGGEWIASTRDSQYYRIDHENTVGSALTDEEVRRGHIQGPDPVSRDSTIDAYLPISGLTISPANRLAVHTADEWALAQPSRAQTNELLYDLFESILPALRRLPGNEGYSYSSTLSSSPHYLSETTPDQIGAAGEALGGLGDAFVELGRSMQTVGRQWQTRSSMSSSTAYSSEQMQTHVQALRRLLSTAALATPFLQATLAPTAPDQPPLPPAAANNGRGAERIRSAGDMPQHSPHQIAILMANSRRNHRHQSLVSEFGASPQTRPWGPIGIELTMHPMSAPLFSHFVRADLPQQQQQQQRQQQQAQPVPPSQAHTSGIAHLTFSVSSLGRPADGTSANVGHSLPADMGGHSDQPELLAFIRSQIEQIQPHITRAPQNPATGPVATAVPLSPLPGGPRSSISATQPNANATAGTSSSDINAGFAGFVERLGTLGSQSARSDRSNLSTTTEHGSVNDVATRMPRVITINLGGSSGGIVQTHTDNPFSISSVFLGTETGSATASTSRRPSAASSASVAQTSDVNGHTGGTPHEPRANNVRSRSESMSSSGSSADGTAAASSTLAGQRGSGPSKRHKTGDSPRTKDHDSAGDT